MEVRPEGGQECMDWAEASVLGLGLEGELGYRQAGFEIFDDKLLKALIGRFIGLSRIDFMESLVEFGLRNKVELRLGSLRC